jgi:hypothetical protein
VGPTDQWLCTKIDHLVEAFADADISIKNIDTKWKYRDNIDSTFHIDMQLYWECT